MKQWPSRNGVAGCCYFFLGKNSCCYLLAKLTLSENVDRIEVQKLN